MGRVGTSNGVIDLAGFTLTATNLTLGQFGGSGTIVHNGGRLAVTNLDLRSANSVALTLHANTAAKSAEVSGGAVMHTVATSNLTTNVSVFDQGTLLNLGTDLVLSGDIDIRGTGLNPSTLNANGMNVTARDIYIGRIALVGDIANDGAITATRTLHVSRGTFFPRNVPVH